jgi:hypothetical protein
MNAVPLRFGIVGYGMMGKAHSYGYRVAPLLRRVRRIRAEHPSHPYAAGW